MPANNYRVDFTSQLVINTSTTDSSVQVPTNPPLNVQNSNVKGSWWIVTVAGTPAYINANAAATSSNILFPIGTFGPVWIDQGVTVHALASFR